MNTKKKVRMLSAVLAAALAISACSNGNGGNNGGNNTTEPSNDASKGEAAATLDPNVPGWKSDTSPITFDWYMHFNWAAGDWGKNYSTKYVTEKTGVNINFIIPPGNESDKLNTMIASGKMPDFLTISWSDAAVQQLIDGGLLSPLNELAKEYDPYFFQAADPAKLSWYTQKDGNVYGYPNASSSPKDYELYGDQYSSNQTFIVKKDMYEAIGSPDMTTPEGFLGALRAAKEKFPKVNGQPLIPIGFTEFTDTGSYSFMDGLKLDSLLQNFLAIPMEKDGKIHDRQSDPEFVKWLRVFRQANEEGLIAKDVFIDKHEQIQEKFTQGRYFASVFQAGDMAGPNAELYKKDPNSVYIAVDGPMNANKDKPTLYGPGISGWTLTLISKNVKDKARAIRFLSYMLSEEGQKDMYLGKQGETWDTIDGKDQLLPKLVEEKKKDGAAFDKKYKLEHAYWMLMDTNMSQKWSMPVEEPNLQPKQWTAGKIVNMSRFELINPSGTSDDGKRANKIALLWGDTLPKLILAKSEAEFDEIFSAFLAKRDKEGFAAVTEYRQQRFEENVKKLEQ